MQKYLLVKNERYMTNIESKSRKIAHLECISREVLPFLPRKDIKTVDDPLTEEEIFFVGKFLPQAFAQIAAGIKGRMIDYTGNFFVVTFVDEVKSEPLIEQKEEKRVESEELITENI
jgi:hypothetical protein